MKDCRNCAGNRTCDHHNFGWETCNNWQPIIVHCKDCLYCHHDNIGRGIVLAICEVWDDLSTTEDSFCSHGERKGND